MVAGPEYGAILSLAFGVTRRDASRVARSAAALAIGSTLAALAALLLSLVVRWAGLAPAAYTLGSPVSNLIDAPNSFFLPRRCPGWRGRCHLTHRGPVEHDYRGGHLGHHHPDSVGHRCVCRVRQLDRGLGLRCPAGAQRFGPYRRCDPGASGSAGSLAASDPPQLHSASRLGRNGSDRPNSASSSGHHPQRMMRRGVKSATLLMSQISERVAVNCSWMSPTEGSVSS